VTLNTRQKQAAMQWYLQQPKPGVEIPMEKWNAIVPVANGISLPLWGRPAHPAQIQWLADNDMTEPQQIHQAFGSLPHPNAPSVSVSEYPQYQHAMDIFEKNK
jgi:hypothetical protein